MQTLNATDTAARQVGRAGAALFVEKRATTDFVHKARLSLHLGLISLMLIAFAYYAARAKARNIGTPPEAGRWQWQLRNRKCFGRLRQAAG